MKRGVLLLVSGCAWAVMMAVLVRREVLPYFEYQAPPSYRTYLRGKLQPEVTLSSIRLGTMRVGEIESLVLLEEEERYRLITRMKMPFEKRVLLLASQTQIDRAHQLIDFDLRGRYAGVPFSLRGARQGAKLRMDYDFVLMKGRRDDIPFPKDTVFSAGFLPVLGGGKLRVGKKWKIKSAPVGEMLWGKGLGGFTTADLYATVEARKSIRYKSRDVRCWEVWIRKRPTDELPSHKIFVNEDGVVLRTMFTAGALEYEVRLEEKRTLGAEEARAWKWSVPSP